MITMKRLELFVIIGILIFLVSPVDGITDNNSNNSNSNNSNSNNSNSNNSNSTTYRTFVDSYKGLYRVINMNTKNYTSYENKTLNINIGDTVEWVNDDDIGLTIISNEKLWKDKYGYMKSTFKRFNHTFTKPGNYTFYIRQYSTKFQPQTIVVKSSSAYSIKSNKSIVTKSNSTINTSRKTVIRIINSDSSNNSKSNDSEKLSNLGESPNWSINRINKFSNEIFLSIMVVCTIYIMTKFKKRI